ncbi:MAG: NPCBM/NEW2 domain-containing protein [Planctomycetales bacterium]|nr:NPCBM/NEW2 domain-containing protein [Planctomycetales bacterium]
MICYATLLMAAVLAAPEQAPRAEVVQLDGVRVEGGLLDLSEEHIVLETSAGEKSIDRRALLTIRLAGENEPKDTLPVHLEMIDGSRLRGTSLQFDGKGAMQLDSDLWGELKLESRHVAAVRFAGEGMPLDGQWNEIRTLRPAADLLVIRKDDALDYVEGRVLEVGEKVVFDLDGDLINVRLSKVAGIIFLRPEASLPDPLGVVHASTASLQVRRLNWREGQFQLTTVAGMELKLPAKDVRLIDLAAGKIRFLSDLEPAAFEYQPFLPLPVSTAVAPFFGARRDLAREGGEIRIAGRTFAKGLALRSRSQLDYRLPAGYSRLQATAGIDDRIHGAGNVQLKILGDGKELLSVAVAGDRPAEGIDLAIDGVKRLTIIVDYGSDSDLGDYLNLGDARITK